MNDQQTAIGACLYAAKKLDALPELAAGLRLAALLLDNLPVRTGSRSPLTPDDSHETHVAMGAPPVAQGTGGLAPLVSHHGEPLKAVTPGDEPVPPPPGAVARQRAVGTCPDCGGQLRHYDHCGKAPAPEPPKAVGPSRCCTLEPGHAEPHKYVAGVQT